MRSRILRSCVLALAVLVAACGAGEQPAGGTGEVSMRETPRQPAQPLVPLDTLIDSIAALPGEFNYTGSGMLYFDGDDSVFARFYDQGEAAVQRLIGCLDRGEPAIATFEGRPVPVGYVCYYVLTSIAMVTLFDDPEEMAAWPGALDPSASEEELIAAKEIWIDVFETGVYRID